MSEHHHPGLNIIMPDKDTNIKRIAITMDGELPIMMHMNQTMPLAAIIRTVCDKWQLATPEDYALQFCDTKGDKYITERNRFEIDNGDILKLTSSPLKTVDTIIQQLSTGTLQEKAAAFKQLSKFSSDITFATEFINKSGMNMLISMVETNKYSGESLAYLLKAFVELMDHGIVSWDVLESQFIKTVSSYVINNKKKLADIDPIALQSSLEILESIVLQSSTKTLVEQEVSPDSLVQHLTVPNPEIQKCAVALINAMFMKASLEQKKVIADRLQTKSVRNIILQNIVSSSVGSEMAHQLYALQTLLFGLLEERMLTRYSSQDQTAVKVLFELRKVAFDSEQEDQPQKRQNQQNQKYWKKLGFENTTNPLEDFVKTPPGMLALDTMHYFATHHGETFTKIVLESSCRADQHDCPFSKASVALTTMMCDILKVGSVPKEEDETYFPMFFTCDKPFEEFYCVCIQLLHKTWKEMRASAEDFPKVLNVVREQIIRALDTLPSTFDLFRKKLTHLTFSEITNIWQQERQHKEEWESQAKPIIELRELIKPEIMDIIKQQRLNHLVEGCRFIEKKSRKDKFFYCRLSHNHKVFHYGECTENEQPAIEQLPHKFPVVEIKEVKIGKDASEYFKGSKVQGYQHIFTVLLDTSEQPVNFIAPSEQEFFMWLDGIDALLGNTMTSKLTETDLDTLLSMEIKLRLLDIEGITIPEQPPEIPAEPDNYNFCTP